MVSAATLLGGTLAWLLVVLFVGSVLASLHGLLGGEPPRLPISVLAHVTGMAAG